MRARLAFALRRLTGAALTVLGVSLTVFLLRHAVPGDPIDAMLGENATEGQREELRRCLDMDKSLAASLPPSRGTSARGRSASRASTCAPPCGRRWPAHPRTIELALAAVALALVIALPLGTLAALRPGSWLDSAVMATSLLGIAVPTMWLGPLLLAYFYVRLGWFPGPAYSGLGGGGARAPGLHAGQPPGGDARPHDPASSPLDAAAEDYMRTARAQGVGARRLVRHALRNALLPVVTVAGIELGALLAGAIIRPEDFRPPRPGDAAPRQHQRARLEGRAGRGAGRGRVVRRGQLARRPGLRGPRPADPGRLPARSPAPPGCGGSPGRARPPSPVACSCSPSCSPPRWGRSARPTRRSRRISITCWRPRAARTCSAPTRTVATSFDVLGSASRAATAGATVVICLLSAIVGAMAGYFGGWLEEVLMRPVDILFAFPGILLNLAIVALVKKPSAGVRGLRAVGQRLGRLRRVARGQTLAVREREYVLAARAPGPASRASSCATSCRDPSGRSSCRRRSASAA